VSVVFSGLPSLVIEDVSDQEDMIVVRARTAGGAVPCPQCGGLTGHVHGHYVRTLADVPADGRPVVVHVRVRRLRCPVLDCPVQTFREQVPGVLDRCQRRTTRLTGQAGEVTRRLAGRAGSALATALGIPLTRHAALRVLLSLPLPAVAVPRVLGIDDFALPDRGLRRQSKQRPPAVEGVTATTNSTPPQLCTFHPGRRRPIGAKTPAAGNSHPRAT